MSASEPDTTQPNGANTAIMIIPGVRAPIPTLLRGALIERYGRTCQYCHATSSSLLEGPDGEAWQIDHRMPVVRGGSNDEDNLTLSCAACNRKKAAAHPEEDWRNRPAKAATDLGRAQRQRYAAGYLTRAELTKMDEARRHALGALVALDELIGTRTPAPCYVSLGWLGENSAIRHLGIGLEDIYSGRVQAKRKVAQGFTWYVAIRSVHRYIEEIFHCTIDELRAEIAESMP